MVLICFCTQSDASVQLRCCFVEGNPPLHRLQYAPVCSRRVDKSMTTTVGSPRRSTEASRQRPGVMAREQLAATGWGVSGARRRPVHRRKPKVAEICAPVAVQQHVRRFDVTVHDRRCMSARQRTTDLTDQPIDPFELPARAHGDRRRACRRRSAGTPRTHCAARARNRRAARCGGTSRLTSCASTSNRDTNSGSRCIGALGPLPETFMDQLDRRWARTAITRRCTSGDGSKPSLAKIRVVWVSTVRSLITSRSAIA